MSALSNPSRIPLDCNGIDRMNRLRRMVGLSLFNVKCMLYDYTYCFAATFLSSKITSRLDPIRTRHRHYANCSSTSGTTRVSTTWPLYLVTWLNMGVCSRSTRHRGAGHAWRMQRNRSIDRSAIDRFMMSGFSRDSWTRSSVQDQRVYETKRKLLHVMG